MSTLTPAHHMQVNEIISRHQVYGYVYAMEIDVVRLSGVTKGSLEGAFPKAPGEVKS